MCNSVNRDEADARMRSYLLLCLGMEGQSQVKQKRPGLHLQTTTTRQLKPVLEEILLHIESFHSTDKVLSAVNKGKKH